MPRFYCPVSLTPGAELALPAATARHVQVLRLQPGETIALFNGTGGEYTASILRMGRSEVDVRVTDHTTQDRAAARPVHLALGMPANERMDWLVEKATELGVASIQPLHTAHCVMRLTGERASRRQLHWQSVAAAASEQCGGNRLPAVHAVAELTLWLRATTASPSPSPSSATATATATEGAPVGYRFVLSLASDSVPLARALRSSPAKPVGAEDGAEVGAEAAGITLLSGPEGGLSSAEEAAAREAGFQPVTLGPRVLRAETAALTALVLALA